jgi:hypothetical protein
MANLLEIHGQIGGRRVFIGEEGDPHKFIEPARGPVHLMFPDADFPFARQPVLETLHNLAETVSEIVGVFEAKFVRRN